MKLQVVPMNVYTDKRLIVCVSKLCESNQVVVPFTCDTLVSVHFRFTFTFVSVPDISFYLIIIYFSKIRYDVNYNIILFRKCFFFFFFHVEPGNDSSLSRISLYLYRDTATSLAFNYGCHILNNL